MQFCYHYHIGHHNRSIIINPIVETVVMHRVVIYSTSNANLVIKCYCIGQHNRSIIINPIVETVVMHRVVIYSTSNAILLPLTSVQIQAKAAMYKYTKHKI